MDAPIRTARLALVPVVAEDADELAAVFADERLYAFTGGGPGTVEELRETLGRLARGRAADPWAQRNWVVRRLADRRAVGLVQAVFGDGGRSAEIAWLVGVPWQGQGLASEAATAVVTWLAARGVAQVTAWIRPDHYGDPASEVLNVRENVGIIDVTPLGKFDLRGPDVPKLLNHLYVNGWDNLDVGAVRYGVMCLEDGVVFDDGVTGRLGPERYIMTTTSSGAGGVWEWMDNWLQTAHPGWQIHVTPVTTAYASINVAGPKSRELLLRLTDGVDLSPDAFPYMRVRTGRIAGVDDCFMWRIGFTGGGNNTGDACTLIDTDADGLANYAFCVVVDGSPDDSHEWLRAELPRSGLDARLILLARNFGSFAAISAGLAEASGDYFAVLAADLQDPPEIAEKFFAALSTGDVDVVVMAGNVPLFTPPGTQPVQVEPAQRIGLELRDP